MMHDARSNLISRDTAAVDSHSCASEQQRFSPKAPRSAGLNRFGECAVSCALQTSRSASRCIPRATNSLDPPFLRTLMTFSLSSLAQNVAAQPPFPPAAWTATLYKNWDWSSGVRAFVLGQGTRRGGVEL
ncbi:hypothetical protein GOODEAATRI_021433 [Goodea atripinnis]|uniref:Uncharacterized protein n=1 Tax=Goodea atripinnis TaxID=208336 RepID=A0ABV0NWJ8_9TELE